MHEEIQILKRIKYEYDHNDSDSYSLNDSNSIRRSSRMTKPNKTLQDYEVMMGKTFDDKQESDTSSFGRERAWSNSSGYSGTSSSSDDPEVLEAAKILLLLREQWQDNKPQTPDSVYEAIKALGTRWDKKRRAYPCAPVINPNMRRSFEGVKYSSMDPEQAARRKKNTEAARYSRYQSRLREEQLEKELEESEISNTDAKWQVATKRAYLRGLFSQVGIDMVDFDSPDGLEDAKLAVEQKCMLHGITPPESDD